jgi:hypothetical protein
LPRACKARGKKVNGQGTERGNDREQGAERAPRADARGPTENPSPAFTPKLASRGTNEHLPICCHRFQLGSLEFCLQASDVRVQRAKKRELGLLKRQRDSLQEHVRPKTWGTVHAGYPPPVHCTTRYPTKGRKGEGGSRRQHPTVRVAPITCCVSRAPFRSSSLPRSISSSNPYTRRK